jgi:hypothetical protein
MERAISPSTLFHLHTEKKEKSQQFFLRVLVRKSHSKVSHLERKTNYYHLKERDFVFILNFQNLFFILNNNTRLDIFKVIFCGWIIHMSGELQVVEKTHE